MRPTTEQMKTEAILAVEHGQSAQECHPPDEDGNVTFKVDDGREFFEVTVSPDGDIIAVLDWNRSYR